MGYLATVKTIQDVAERHLCCGCGVCAYLAPDAIAMVDVLEQGRRPKVKEAANHESQLREALQACPGITLDHEFNPAEAGWIPELVKTWGPVKNIYEGHACDEEFRFAGSSGGAASALALY
ncbi:MAG: ferredoxin, partial [Planctomycetes bacterium]|nr:ferredoxin [Planctomycetota bacterium]